MPAPKKPRTAHCPACRKLQTIRIVGTATAARQPVHLAQCLAADCELIWALPQHVLAGPPTAPASAAPLPPGGTTSH